MIFYPKIIINTKMYNYISSDETKKHLLYFLNYDIAIMIHSYCHFIPKNKEELVIAVNEWNRNNPVALSKYGHISTWDTSLINDMSKLFHSIQDPYDPLYYKYFNDDISSWNVKNVKNMSYMFCGNKLFNQPIQKWNVKNVVHMEGMFCGAKSFNQPIGIWKTINVQSMCYMMSGADSFNQPISEWNTSSVINLKGMFFEAYSFNQSIDKWDISKVQNINYIFNGAISFTFFNILDKWNVLHT